MTASEIIEKYIAFFEKKGHKRIPGAPLVSLDDPSTLFTCSGMQPLVSYLLGERHPMGKRLVNVQNCFRAVDIDEVGDSRHDTFFRMLGNWSLGDYFKKEQILWIWEFVTKELKIPVHKLYVSVFKGYKEIPKDTVSEKIWTQIFKKEKLNPKERIFFYDKKNWWSKSGDIDSMPEGEPGGPDSEIFYKFDVPHDNKFGKECHPNCQCGKFMEIVNSVFMEYQKLGDGNFKKLPQQNVDHGAGVERLLAAVEDKQDIFATNLYESIIKSIERATEKKYADTKRKMQIIADHLIASVFITAGNIIPSNKEQGYILRRLIRRAMMYGEKLKENTDFKEIILSIIDSYKNTDPDLIVKKDFIINEIKNEEQKFKVALKAGISYALKELEDLNKTIKFIIESPFANNVSLIMTKGYTYLDQTQADILNELITLAKNTGIKPCNINEAPKTKVKMPENDRKRMLEIFDYFKKNRLCLNSRWAFRFVTSYGTPLEILNEIVIDNGFEINTKDFNKLMEEHKNISRIGATKKFTGGLADHSEKTIRGHTATHLLHKTLRDLLGDNVHQAGSNITSERIRFDFNYDKNLTSEAIKAIENTVNKKIKENLPVKFEIISLQKAKEIGAVGLFDEKYSDKVKVYSIGPSISSGQAYSIEICGGPHVAFTSEIKSFRIIKQENIGKGNRRIYAKVG